MSEIHLRRRSLSEFLRYVAEKLRDGSMTPETAANVLEVKAATHATEGIDSYTIGTAGRCADPDCDGEAQHDGQHVRLSMSDLSVRFGHGLGLFAQVRGSITNSLVDRQHKRARLSITESRALERCAGSPKQGGASSQQATRQAAPGAVLQASR